MLVSALVTNVDDGFIKTQKYFIFVLLGCELPSYLMLSFHCLGFFSPSLKVTEVGLIVPANLKTANVKSQCNSPRSI